MGWKGQPLSVPPWLMSHKNVPVGQPTFEHLDALPEGPLLTGIYRCRHRP